MISSPLRVMMPQPDRFSLRRYKFDILDEGIYTAAVSVIVGGAGTSVWLPYTVTSPDGRQYHFIVDQFASSASHWEELGLCILSKGQATVTLSTWGTENALYVLADAVKLSFRRSITEDIGSEGEVNFFGTWLTSSTAPGFLGADYKYSTSIANRAQYRLPLVRGLGEYDVYTAHAAHANRSPRAPVRIR